MVKDHSVFGIYPTQNEAESGVAAFKEMGFCAADISVLLPDSLESKDLVADNGTKAPESAIIGVGSGAAVGGAVGWLVGVGAVMIPGLGPVIAAGPIAAALAGIGIGGALGGFAGCLVGVGVPESEI